MSAGFQTKRVDLEPLSAFILGLMLAAARSLKDVEGERLILKLKAAHERRDVAERKLLMIEIERHVNSQARGRNK